MSRPTRAALLSLLALAVLGPRVVSSAPTDPWRVLPLVSGEDDRARVVDVTFSPLDPDRLLAWSGGLLYRSTDGGDDWTLVPAQFVNEGPSPPLRGLRLDAVNLDVAWAMRRNRILLTTDFGRTWIPWGTPAPGDIEAFDLVAGNPDALWLVISSAPGVGLWKTTDGGATWLSRDDDLLAATTWAISARPGHPETLVAGTGDGLARTTDDGATWDWVRVGARAKQIRWSADGDVVRAYQSGLVESTDAGLTWTAIPSVIRDGRKTYAFDPFDPARILLSNVDFCGASGYRYGHFGTTQRSTDGGENWIREDLTGCLYYQYVGNIGGSVERTGDTAWSWMSQTLAAPLALQKTTDGGETWTNSTAGMKELPLLVFDVDGAGTAYVRDDYGIDWTATMRRSTDAGATWPELDDWAWWSFDQSNFLLASRNRPGDLLEGGFGDAGWEYVQRSTDGGENWVLCEYCTWGSPYRAAFNHGTGDTLYVWGGGSWWEGPPPETTYLHRSDDGGLEFDVLGESPFVPVAALVTPESDYVVFAATWDAEPVVRTTDAGVTWHARSDGLPARTPVALLMDPTNGDHLVVAFGSGLPWESTDGGATWRALAVGLDPARGGPEESPVPPDLDLRGILIQDADWDVAAGQRRVFLATDQGIWVSDLGFVGTKRPQIAFDWVRYSRATGVLMAGSRRHGMFAVNLAAFGPLGDPATATPLASTFAPLSLAPNPFAGSASIRFGLGRAGSARLDVFDPAGRRVATLVDGRLAAGGHAYTWSGRNEAGRSVAPGVYFLRLSTAEQRVTRRIVRLR